MSDDTSSHVRVSHLYDELLVTDSTATLNKRLWVHLQLRFEALNAVASDGFKWQYIAIIATFSSLLCFTIHQEVRSIVYTVSQKVPTFKLSVTLSNLNRLLESV